MEEIVKDFCHKYDAYVQPSSRMHRRVKRVPYSVWSESDPGIVNELSYTEIKCVEIHMPEDRFRALIQHSDWLAEAARNDRGFASNHLMQAQDIIDEHERECRIRNENASVNAAYEKYQNLLKLVDSYYE